MVDRFRRYRILVDEQMVAKISNGETLDLRLEPGSHRLELRVDWTGSAPPQIEAEPGEELEVVVERPDRGPAARGVARAARTR